MSRQKQRPMKPLDENAQGLGSSARATHLAKTSRTRSSERPCESSTVFSELDAPTEVRRTEKPVQDFPLLAEMYVERGDVSSWRELHELHYKAEHLPIGPKFWRLDLQGRTIGVLVTGSSKGLLKERHIVFPNIKPGRETRITNTARYHYINRNFRVISRFVIDTMYRGIGCGYRMMNIASRMEGVNFMEIQSSMSKFNFFGQKAGFRFVKPMNANKYEAGLRFFRQHFDSNPKDFEAIVAELLGKPEAERERLLHECRSFYYKHSALENTGNNRDRGEARAHAMDAKHVVKAIQQLSFASPMYGVWKNPDRGLVLPERVPLTAFDNQGPNDPFRL